MATISQTTFSNTYWWIKHFYFNFNFAEVCSQGSNGQYGSISSGNGLVPNRQQAITWTNVTAVHQRIYAALGGDELSLGNGLSIVLYQDTANTNADLLVLSYHELIFNCPASYDLKQLELTSICRISYPYMRICVSEAGIKGKDM